MALRADSYSSVEEVRAMTRHLLDGEATFTPTTRPTLTDVETIIDRASAVLNGALASAGFTTPVTNSTAVLMCDEWVTMAAARQVELTQRGTGYNAEDGSRLAGFNVTAAAEWVTQMKGALIGLGLSTGGRPAHEGLMFTGLYDRDERTDPDETTYEQPKFRRGLFDA